MATLNINGINVSLTVAELKELIATGDINTLAADTTVRTTMVA